MSRAFASQGRTVFSTFRRGANRYDARPSKWQGFELYLDITNLFNTWESRAVQLPTVSNGTYNFTVEWGDGTTDTITVWNQAETLHTYTSNGFYRIRISGTYEGFVLGNADPIDFPSTAYRYNFQYALTFITQFGPSFKLVNRGFPSAYFYGAENLVEVGKDLDLTGPNGNITGFSSVFYNCTRLIGKNVGNWKLKPTSLREAFRNARSFNGDIRYWDTSTCTNIFRTFIYAFSFNQDISGWNVSAVTTAGNTFYYARSFNQDISIWNINGSLDIRFQADLDFPTVVEGFFNQDLGSIIWNANTSIGLDYCGMSVENYSKSIIGWANYASANSITNKVISALGLKYNNLTYGSGTYTTAVAASSYLIAQGWTLTDAGQV